MIFERMGLLVIWVLCFAGGEAWCQTMITTYDDEY